MSFSSTCIARYRADSGVFSDAGITAAVAGSTVYQWNDLSGNSHHMVQTNTANRPLFSSTPVGQSSTRSSIFFNGSSTFLDLSTSLNLPGAGCAVLLCSRGTGSIVSIGTTNPFSYGFQNGPPDGMALADSTVHPFPDQTYLPAFTPIAHGFRTTPAITRLIIGTNQTSDLSYDTSTFSSSGGAIGQSFLGDIYELAIFSPAPDDTTLDQLIADLQDFNGITDDANTNQIIFIGDSNIAGCPAITCQLNGELLKPLVLAQASHTITQQLGVVHTQLTTLDLNPFYYTFAVVCAGSNDITTGRTANEIFADLATLCTMLQSLRMKVLVATIPDPALTAVNALLQDQYTTFADALIDWASDSRLTDPTNTTVVNDGIKASILQPAIQLILNPPPNASPLNYASFYSAGQTFAASFGQFVKS